jgi:protein NRD1
MDPGKILESLRSLAGTQDQSKMVMTGTGNANLSNVAIPQMPFSQTMTPSVNPATSMPPAAQAVNVQGAPNGISQFPGMNGLNALPPNLLQGFVTGQQMAQAPQPAQPMMQPQNPAVSISPETLQKQLQILQEFQRQGIPQDQWATLLPIVMSTAGSAAPVATPSMQGVFGKDDASRDRSGGYDQYAMHSPRGGHRNRSRSRSPAGWDRRRDSPPNRRRDSPVYGDYERNNRGRGDRRGGQQQGNRGGDHSYRQRSPGRNRRSQSPRRPEQKLAPSGPKWVEYDTGIGEGMIKGMEYTHLSRYPSLCLEYWLMPHTVLSRTLFVGGVT